MMTSEDRPTYAAATRAMREKWWRKCRARIMEVGLDWRDVYQQVGLEREIDATPQQVARIERIIAVQADEAIPVRPSWWRRLVSALTGR